MRYIFGWAMYIDEYCCMGPFLLIFISYDVVETGDVLRVELPVKRRLCPIFLSGVG